MESNDSPEIPDRKETSLTSGVTANSYNLKQTSSRLRRSWWRLHKGVSRTRMTSHTVLFQLLIYRFRLWHSCCDCSFCCDAVKFVRNPAVVPLFISHATTGCDSRLWCCGTFAIFCCCPVYQPCRKRLQSLALMLLNFCQILPFVCAAILTDCKHPSVMLLNFSQILPLSSSLPFMPRLTASPDCYAAELLPEPAIVSVVTDCNSWLSCCGTVVKSQAAIVSATVLTETNACSWCFCWTVA